MFDDVGHPAFVLGVVISGIPTYIGALRGSDITEAITAMPTLTLAITRQVTIIYS